MPTRHPGWRFAIRQCFLLAIFAAVSIAAWAETPQIGGGSCSTSMVNGTYYYMFTGNVVSGAGAGGPYVELGGLVANGSGGVSGNSFASVSGQKRTYSLTGTYSVQANCTGSMTLTTNSLTTTALTFQVVGNAQTMLMASTNSGEIVTGRAYRTTAGSGSPGCGVGSLSGAYGYVFTGLAAVSGASLAYSNSGVLMSDGGGNLTSTNATNLGGSLSNNTGTGSYSIFSNCQGTASIATQAGPANYVFAIVQDGQQVLFLETDAGTTVAGVAQPQFATPQQAVVNGASFQPGMIAPGGLFSILGSGLSPETAEAQTLPLPTILARTQVLVNGTAAPLVYVSTGQINAQIPVGIPIGPMTVTVTNAGTASNSVTLNVPAAAPGIFTIHGTQAIVQDPNGALNSPSTPAHVGDELVAYFTGGGAVKSASWITGGASPASPTSVTASYSLTVGNQQAQVEYVGLTPGFVGLYQANFTVPSLAPGTYPMVVTVAGMSSNAATLVVGG